MTKKQLIQLFIAFLIFGFHTVGYSYFGQGYNEFKVNTTTNGNQWFPSAAMDSAGNFVIAYQSNLQGGGSSTHIIAQRFNYLGTKVGGEIQADTISGTFKSPIVAMDSDGDFVITWYREGNGKGSSWGIYAQIYDENGNPDQNEFPVSSTSNFESYPSIAMTPNGDFVITWQKKTSSGWGVYAQRYSNNGSANGGVIQINSSFQSNETRPAIVVDSNGNFIIAWQSLDSDRLGIFARQYNNCGSPVGSIFQVNTYCSKDQKYPTIAMDCSGNFVIAWQSLDQPSDGSAWGIFAQRYSNNGTKAGSEFLVNDNKQNDQTDPAIAIDCYGYFIIGWQSNATNDGDDALSVRAKMYDNNGNIIQSEFQVNNTTYSNQKYPCIAMMNTDDFVIAWQSEHICANSFDIYAKIYLNTGTLTPTLTPTFTLTPSCTKTATKTCSKTPTKTTTPTPTCTTKTPTPTLTQTLTPLHQTPPESNTPTPTTTYPPNAIRLEYFKAEAKGHNVILTWKTGTEIDTLGFYIVRSVPFGYTIVNKEIIPSMGNPISGHSYSFMDNSVAPAREYLYWLIDMDTSGIYSVHEPVKVITNIENFDSLKN